MSPSLKDKALPLEPFNPRFQKMMGDLNGALLLVQKQLMAKQGDRKDGSLHLRLKDCGRGCSGCPHPNFIIWKARVARSGPTQGQPFLVRLDITRPGKTEAAKKPGIYPLIKAAEDIIEMRSRLLSHHRVLHQYMAQVERNLDQYT